MNEARRKAFAEFEGYMPYGEKDSHWFRTDRDKTEGKLVPLSDLPTYDNETDLFRLIRKLHEVDPDKFSMFCDCLLLITSEATGLDHRKQDAVDHMWLATPDQLQEAIALTLGIEGAE